MSVANLERLKREMLRQVVQENLDLIEGRFAPSPKPSGVMHRGWVLGLGTLLAAGLASALALAANPALVPWGSHREVSISRDRQGPERPPPAANVALPEIIFPEIRGEEQEELAREWTAEELAAARSSPVDAGIFPLEVRRVVLDPGHGGNAFGTQKAGLIEKDIVLDIALRLKPLLEAAGLEVLMTRESDLDVSLQERAQFANQAQADIFVSIHVNWFDGAGEVRGVETYYLGTAKEAYLNRLAARENQASGYALADMRRLLDRIYGGVRVGKSGELASAVHGAMYQSLTRINPKLEDRGVKTAPFLVLVDTEMPAILAEVSCLSNDREAELLGQERYRQVIAESLASGLTAYAAAARAKAPEIAASAASAERIAK